MPNYTADSVLNQTFDATNTALNANLVASTAYIAPMGDTYPDDMALKQIAAHCQLDTIGSRQRYAK